MNKLVCDTSSRLDTYISSKTNLTRSQVKKLVDSNKIFVNDKLVTKAGLILKVNDKITYEEQVEEHIVPKKVDYQIVYEDQYLLVINKPRGLVVHPAHGHLNDTLANGLAYDFSKTSEDITSNFRMGIVHRIDKDTSGLLVVGKTLEAKKKLVDLVSKHLINREYLALAYGFFKDKFFKVDAPIGRDIKDRQKMAVNLINGKEAVTHFTVIKQYQDVALLKCKLETGRTHQIRVHLAYIKHPILGDPLYCSTKNKYLDQGQLLHAYRLSFIHPFLNKKMVFYAPIDNYFKKVLTLVAENKLN